MINGLKLFGLYLSMLGNVFSRPENKKVYWRRILDEMVNLGVNSLTIVSIISLFMGAVVTIQTRSKGKVNSHLLFFEQTCP